MIQMDRTTNQYRKDIQGLRGVSVLMVFLYHFNIGFDNGYLGVDVFFVISGYVITKSLINTPKNFDGLISFYIRRVKRLLPSLLIVLIFTTALATLFIPPKYLYEIMEIGQYSIFGLSNWILISNSIDYFALTGSENIYTHTWSLAVEDQFYFLIAPILIFIVNKNIKNFFLISIFVLSIFFYFFEKNELINFYGTHTRIWEILAGCLIAINEKKLNYLKNNYFFFLGLILFISSLLIDAFGSLLIVAATSFLILISPKKKSLYSRFLENKYIVFTGTISYSLYLWHFPLIAIYEWNLGFYFIYDYVFIFLLSFLIASLNYKYIERPLRYLNWSIKIKKIKINYEYSFILIFIPITIITLMMVRYSPSTAIKLNGGDSYQIAALGKVEAKSDWLDENGEFIGKNCHWSKNSEDKNIFFNKCLKIDKSKKNIYLVGDSHATMLYFSFNEITKRYKNIYNEINYIHNNGIPKILNEGVIPSEIDFILKNITENDILMITFFRGKMYDKIKILKLKEDPFKFDNVNNRFANAKLVLAKISKILESKKSKLILIDDGPILGQRKRAESCLAALKIRSKDVCAVNKEQSLHDRKPMTQVFKEVSANYENVYYIDYHNLVCLNKCSVIRNNKLNMIDFNHISRSTSIELSDFFYKKLIEIQND